MTDKFKTTVWEKQLLKELDTNLELLSEPPTRKDKIKWFIRKWFMKLTPFVIVSRKGLERYNDDR